MVASEAMYATDTTLSDQDTAVAQRGRFRRGRLAMGLGLLALSVAACSMGPAAAPSQTRATVAATSPSPGEGHLEVQQFGANTFERYQNASGREGHLAIGDTVMATCIVYDPGTPVTSTRGLWYRFRTHDGRIMYVATNTFWNQDPPQPPDQDHPYDSSVPVCRDSPAQDLPDEATVANGARHR